MARTGVDCRGEISINARAADLIQRSVTEKHESNQTLVTKAVGAAHLDSAADERRPSGTR